MAKYSGKIGFSIPVETAPGVTNIVMTYRPYHGDVERKAYKANSNSETTNDDINVSNKISILANDFAFKNFKYIKCVEFMGVLWNISDIEVVYPRLILTIGGIFNERPNEEEI